MDHLGVDEAFFRQLEEVSQLQALALMGDLDHFNTCSKDNTAGNKQSRFLACLDGKFLIKLIEEMTRGDSLLNLMLTNEEQLSRDVKMRSSVGCSDHEIVELRILRGGHKTKSRIMTLDVRTQTLTSLEICLEESQ